MVSPREKPGKDLLVIGGLLVIAVALILYLVMRSENNDVPRAEPSASAVAHPTAGTKAPTAEDKSALGVQRRLADDPLALGKPDAPVVMVMFADYRCPFCAKFSRDTEPELIRRFVDTGVLRMEWRDYPIFGEQSMLAARAGRAAAEQGKFWEFKNAVFAVAPQRGHADLTEDALLGFAKQVGVPDLNAFAAGTRGTAFDAAINSDVSQATSIGVPSTPAFVVNGTPILGAQPTADFVRAIEDANAQS
ncbi:MAG: thioredoxin domain-containing protein [Actinomycetota bacterium]